MALTKRELLQSGGIENQEALVKRLQEKTKIPPVRRQIPGGKKLLEQVDQAVMEKAVYNWLRGCRAFSEVTLSFAKEPEKFQCKVRKMRDFNADGPREEWESNPEGRKVLARYMAEILNSHQMVKLVAKKDGIWLYQDAEGKFGPTRTVTEADVAEQQALVKEVVEEMEAAGEDPSTLAYNKLVIGDRTPSEDWSPYIEFIPKRKKEYGR
jgi:hypothetical protein